MIGKYLASASLALLPLLATAQTSEIFIPGADNAAPPAAVPQSPLAACLANPDAQNCAAVDLDPGGIALESATAGPQVQFETLVLDLDGGHVKAQPEPPAKTPDYTDDAPPATHGKVALPSVAISIEFDYNSDQIRADQIGKVASLIGALQDPSLAGAQYAVIGHTDAAGSEGYNCDLSYRRAGAVTAALQGSYVNVPLYPVGFGEYVLKNTYDPHAPENRRVTFLRLPAYPDSVLATAGAVCRY